MLFLTEDNDFAGDSQVSKPKVAPHKPDAPLSIIVKNHLNGSYSDFRIPFYFCLHPTQKISYEEVVKLNDGV
jgi:hypothetical protein